MKHFSYNRILLFVILIGFIASLVINIERYHVEEANQTVDLAIDYEGLVELAEREGVPVPEVLAQAKEAGITSLAVYDTTFKKLNLNGKAHATNGADILTAYHSGRLVDPMWRALVESGKIAPTKVYVTGHQESTFRELKEDLVRRLGSDRVEFLQVGNEEIIACAAHYESFLKLDMGMPTDEMRIVNDAGFYVLARPTNFQNATREDVAFVFQRLEGIRISEVVYSGPEMLGALKSIDDTAEFMKERNMTLGLLEDMTQLQFVKQAGLEDLAIGVGYDKIARLYTITKDEMLKLKISDAVDRWVSTDRERNIRINLMRIYEKPAPNMTLLETNLTYFRATKEALEAHGFTIGKASTFVDYQPSRLLRALVLAGVVAAGVLYLSLVSQWINRKSAWQYALFFLGALVFVIPIWMGVGGKVRIVAALMSANLFPTLAVISMLDFIRKRRPEQLGIIRLLVSAFSALLACGALSYVGAAYLSAALSDTSYFLEFGIFRGIKLTFVLPLVLVAIAFLARYDIFDGKFDNSAGIVGQLKELLDMPIKVKTLLFILFGVGAMVVFVLRSGHTSGLPVAGLEIKFRNMLEHLFYARPRSKELMIGHPAFMLAALAWQRRWPTMVLFLFVIVATIGQGSMVETFAHMRTPVEMSFFRGLGGILFGGIIGAAAVLAIDLWQRIIRSVKERS
ncbi:DUF5693 family protein [Selenomonas sp. TAMA-11512]|uniref:DUF5693 family protein n=1 Tax=Selenomonas sp. TAMA-11512 TaxID=3095337 RepID=UPI00308CEFF1|nr:DUF5693 family protein [Selenomonas sp. TAMA-11512]